MIISLESLVEWMVRLIMVSDAQLCGLSLFEQLNHLHVSLQLENIV